MAGICKSVITAVFVREYELLHVFVGRRIATLLQIYAGLSSVRRVRKSFRILKSSMCDEFKEMINKSKP